MDISDAHMGASGMVENMTEAHSDPNSSNAINGADVPVEEIRRSVNAEFGKTVDELKSLVAIPGIAWEAFDASQLDKSAAAVAELIKDAGVSDVQILRVNKEDGTPGGPAIVARKPAAPGFPTVVLYAHHDVQPPAELTLWNTEPFVAVEKDGRLFGRGAADDKAGIMAHVSALRSLSDVLGDDFKLGVTYFIEGEEEAGSPTFATFLKTHHALLEGDVIIVADSGNWQVGVPALTTSLRGLVDGTIEVRVLDHAVHSGMFGGPVLDAVTLLSRLIASFHDADGAVAIEGLVQRDDAQIEYEESVFRADSGVLDGVQLTGSGSLASRLWTKPALSIIGVDVPSVAMSSNTMLPAARAKFSLRLAPGQDPAAALEAVKAHVDQHAPFGAQVTLTPGEMGQAFATDTSLPAAQTALWALATSWGVTPVESGMGGSIPFIADLNEQFPNAAILVTGVEDPDSRAHSANESLHLGDFEKAIVAEALILAAMNKAK